MAEMSTRAWTRPHDWAEVVLGVVAALTPLWMDTSAAALWILVVLGALVALDGLVSLARPGLIYGEGIQVVLGVLLFISPWVMSYTALSGAAWSSWIIGGLTVIVGAAAFPVATAVRDRMAGQH